MLLKTELSMGHAQFSSHAQFSFELSKRHAQLRIELSKVLAQLARATQPVRCHSTRRTFLRIVLAIPCGLASLSTGEGASRLKYAPYVLPERVGLARLHAQGERLSCEASTLAALAHSRDASECAEGDAKGAAY